MISIIPLGVLVRAHQRGFDIHSLQAIPKEEIQPVFDASNNEMNFVRAVRIKVELEGGRSSDVAFHVAKSDEEEILLGINASPSLGVRLSLMKDETKMKKEPIYMGEVRVTQRTYIPPYQALLVPVQCDAIEDVAEIVLWPSKKGIPAGVFKISHSETVLPVTNTQDEPLLLKKGESVRHWGTEKWKENREDLGLLMLTKEKENLRAEERSETLLRQISENMKSEQVEEDLANLLREFQDSFAIADNELMTRTDLVEMTIDTGNSEPIKMKTRPVPLGVRQKLKELMEDLLDRNIIERSQSSWAISIVLVEKKDGTLPLCVDYRELSKRIKLDSYSLPTIDAVLQSMAGKQYFSTLDLSSGYWQNLFRQKRGKNRPSQPLREYSSSMLRHSG
ncbi:hypothetical protein Y032_0094g2749 [Ancylostoma ceylanicum]|uniref:Reverse transcriptase domain-containing protein n=1 Tax=Ancylostoma ceylanicum TaxID=53326 RepID=A0A016TL45_9BILA|nr:hypothetical protein Y032_0094g2749 [Ancylostoma ceylanicum]